MDTQSTLTARRQSIARANAGAAAQAALGHVATPAGWTIDGIAFLVPSATHEGHTYRVTMHRAGAGWASECNCKAAEHGRICWHRSAARQVMVGEPAPVATTDPQQCATCGLFSSTVLASGSGRCESCDIARRPAITAAMLSGKG